MRSAAAAALLALLAAGCGSGGYELVFPDPHTDPSTGPAAGNPDGACAVPADGLAEDVSSPTTVVGTGTPASCTGEAFVTAVETGGVVTFDCGPDPVILTVPRTAKVRNDHGPKIVIDGGGLVTLSGAGARRILYMNTCDPAQVWTTSHCQDQDHPLLTVQNLTFVDGNAYGVSEDEGLAGGGAIFSRGGRLKVVNARFFHNSCDRTGPDVGGGAIRAFDQYSDLPVYVVGSTFGGSGRLGNYGSNGGALSSIGVSWTVLNSLFAWNYAIGNGANPAELGTPGGGSGGAIYNDGNAMTLTLCGVQMNDNHANEGGGAIFFVSNDLTGHLSITDSVLAGNPSDGGWDTAGFPGIFYLGNGPILTSGSTIQWPLRGSDPPPGTAAPALRLSSGTRSNAEGAR